MEDETQRKIEETVVNILRTSKMEDITEFKVRLEASKQLGINLFQNERKGFVRSVVEKFLLEEVEEEDYDWPKHKEAAKRKQNGERVICKVTALFFIYPLFSID